MLKRRFGSSHLVAQCVINYLRNGDYATKPTALTAFADEIDSALQTVTQHVARSVRNSLNMRS